MKKIKGFLNYIKRTYPVVAPLNLIMYIVSIGMTIHNKQYVQLCILVSALAATTWAYYQGYKLDRAMLMHRLRQR
jgi:hypothetical protein